MKNLLLGLIFLISTVTAAQQPPTVKAELDLFFGSTEFRNVTSTFKFTIHNINQQNYTFEKSPDDKVHFFRMLVTIDDRPNFLSVYSINKGNSFLVVFEKNALDSNQTSGYFEHYSDLGGFYADFRVTKVGSKYRFTFNDIDVSKRMPTTTAQRHGCVVRVYALIKSACESDATCDLLCDLLPGCHRNMFLAAVGHCLGL